MLPVNLKTFIGRQATINTHISSIWDEIKACVTELHAGCRSAFLQVEGDLASPRGQLPGVHALQQHEALQSVTTVSDIILVHKRQHGLLLPGCDK